MGNVLGAVFATGKILRAALLVPMAIGLASWSNNLAFSQNAVTSLGVNTASPVELILTDPEGRRTGFDPVANSSFRNIPASQYSRTQLCDEQNFTGCQPPL